ncbi:MAG: hypothetical protein OXC12_19690 [Spirochaetaceae bacterium]|nr:hypothetical protein [Spirochaetaceae bacterium]
MTRFASIMGVATVATLVLLSGCEAAMEKTDYVEDLKGTWTIMDLPAMFALPGSTDAVPSMANVNVTIAEGDELNTGTFTVAVTHSIITPPTALPPITASGTFVVDSKNIDVTVDSIDAGPGGGTPANLAPLVGQEIEIGYTFTDDDTLKITNDLLADLGVALPTDPSIELTRSTTQ